MALHSFNDVRNFLTTAMSDNGQFEQLETAPHKDFWNKLSYEQFTNGNMPNLRIAVPILVKSNSSQSNLILSFRGEGPMFNPTDGHPGLMPPKGPVFTVAQVKDLTDWIDAGCPE